MQSETTINPAIECCGVICDDSRLLEVEGGQIAVSIPRENIKRITLRDGFQAPHPVLQIMFGLMFSSLAYFPVRHLIYWAQHGGTLFTIELSVIAFASIGIWLIITAFRQGLFFEVEMDRGAKRVTFHKRPEPSTLDAFVKLIEQRYGIRVEKR